MLWCGWLGMQYNGWVWFWASLSLVVCACGWLLNQSRALRVGAVAALAAFLSGVVQGADQGLPLIAWEWAHWHAAAAGIWVIGSSVATVKPRYTIEAICALLITCIYIYEYVNEDSSFRLLIEIVFFAMLLPSIGGIIGRGRRTSLLDTDRHAGPAIGAAVVDAAKARLRND